MSYTFRTLIIPSATAPSARVLAAALDAGGVGMWTTGLSATGQEPATHYISTGMIGDEFAALLPLQADGVLVSPGQPAYVASAAAQAGIPVTPEQVAGLYALVDVTEQDPHAAMVRLGIQQIVHILS